MKQPLVSIIMNCYNGDSFLRESIDSVYAQTYSNWEIIFWDNASTDDSALIANSYDQHLHYFRAEKTVPLGEARNLALQKVSGKYIAFLDCDDLYLPEKLEKQVQLMEKTGYALCYGSAITINKKGQEIRRVHTKNQSGRLIGELLKHYEINMQSVMLLRSVLEEEKLSFTTELKYCPDHNLFMEVVSRYCVGVLKDFIVKYRVQDDSLSKKTLDIAASEVQFTLDKISQRDPKLKQEFAREFDQAYKKLHYYDAIAAIYKNDRKQARMVLQPIISTKIQYFILYLLLFLPFSKKKILKILGR
ncbi:glycosyltransferase family 2 protein [Deltaproteobacteria bacterium]|nr:glycosyltransferase family 2 protein [Deltaproteobacteria bacterium]